MDLRELYREMLQEKESERGNWFEELKSILNRHFGLVILGIFLPIIFKLGWHLVVLNTFLLLLLRMMAVIFGKKSRLRDIETKLAEFSETDPALVYKIIKWREKSFLKAKVSAEAKVRETYDLAFQQMADLTEVIKKLSKKAQKAESASIKEIYEARIVTAQGLYYEADRLAVQLEERLSELGKRAEKVFARISELKALYSDNEANLMLQEAIIRGEELGELAVQSRLAIEGLEDIITDTYSQFSTISVNCEACEKTIRDIKQIELEVGATR